MSVCRLKESRWWGSLYPGANPGILEQMPRIAVLGGTGPEGSGLALRFALAGEPVIIGSRRQERAEETARLLNARLARFAAAPVEAAANAAAARAADVVTLALPFAGIDPLLTELAPELRGKILLDVVNPLQLSDGLFTVVPVPEGSAAERIQQRVPEAAVVSALKNRSAKELTELHQPLQGDTLLCSDVPEAARAVAALVNSLRRLRVVDVGSLRNARHVESLTALLLNLNRRYRTNTSVQILGLKMPQAGSAAESALTQPGRTSR